MKFRKVAIIGTGLIGGSLALDIKRKGLAKEVVGFSRRKSSLLIAKKKGAIDRGSQDLRIVEGADLIIFATPVDSIISLGRKASGLVGKDVLVTDVGSTKKEIVTVLEKLFSRYVGSHPLAGLEKRSINYACPGLFNNSLCVLTPTKNTDRLALSEVKSLWQKVGARIVVLSPGEHDRILSHVSHLPHAAAFSLINSIPRAFFKFAAGSLKDVTRIAASDNGIWEEIFLSNRENILKGIGCFEENLSELKTALKRKDRKALAAFFKKAKQKRDTLERQHL
jgi:prephenate dehydrogenase